jgi:hypothetical protein
VTRSPASPSPQGIPIGVVIVIAILLRLILAWISIGTNDANTWRRIGSETAQQGLINAYRTDSEINHPPISVVWSRFTLIGRSPRNIALLMKLPAIAGDALSVWLLARIWMRRGDAHRAALASIAMALSPIAILISGYHCNTDNLYAFLSLLAMYLITERQAFFLAGLALGAAINVKLIPVILIPGTYSLCRSWRDASHLTLGLAIWTLPFMPLLIAAPDAVRNNMLNYAPPVSEWGIAMILHELWADPQLQRFAYNAMASYLTLGRWLILLCAAILSAASFRRRRWNGYEVAAISFAFLLVLAPGFGPQYTTIIVPLLLAISIPRAWIWGILAGLYVAFAYFSRLISSGIPMETAFVRNTPTPPGATFGLLAWGTLLETMLLMLLKNVRQPLPPGRGFDVILPQTRPIPQEDRQI